MRRLRQVTHSGITGWVMLIALVIGWDYLHLTNGESMSSAFKRGSRHPVAQWPITITWTVLTLHLFGVLPHRIDPLYRLARIVTGGMRT